MNQPQGTPPTNQINNNNIISSSTPPQLQQSTTTTTSNTTTTTTPPTSGGGNGRGSTPSTHRSYATAEEAMIKIHKSAQSVLDAVEQMMDQVNQVRSSVKHMFDVMKSHANNTNNNNNNNSSSSTTTTTTTTNTTTSATTATTNSNNTTNANSSSSTTTSSDISNTLTYKLFTHARDASQSLHQLSYTYNQNSQMLDSLLASTSNNPQNSNKHVQYKFLSVIVQADELLMEYESTPRLFDSNEELKMEDDDDDNDQEEEEEDKKRKNKHKNINNDNNDNDEQDAIDENETLTDSKEEDGNDYQMTTSQMNTQSNKKKKRKRSMSSSLLAPTFIKSNATLLFDGGLNSTKQKQKAKKQRSNEVPFVRPIIPTSRWSSFISEDLSRLAALINLLNRPLTQLSPPTRSIVKYLSLFNLPTSNSRQNVVTHNTNANINGSSSSSNINSTAIDQSLKMLHVQVGEGTFHAFITVFGKDLNPVQVQIFAMDERMPGSDTLSNSTGGCVTFDTERRRLVREIENVNLHPQERSKHHVFNMISQSCMEAIKYYQQNKETADSQLQCLLLYLTCYEKVFMEKCTTCGKLLHLDSEINGFVPPMRSFLFGRPVHVQCVSNLI